MEFSSISGDDWEVLEDVYVYRQTDRAVHLMTDDGTVAWVPKSQIRDLGHIPDWGNCTEIAVKGWFARKNGLV